MITDHGSKDGEIVVAAMFAGGHTGGARWRGRFRLL